MALRLLYLIFVRLDDWLVPAGATAGSRANCSSSATGIRVNGSPCAQAPADTTRAHRDTDTSWPQVLRMQAASLMTCDLFHVDCAVTLKRIYVFFVMDVATRYIHILGVTTNPNGA
ncbi:transposase family protein [Saccharothrix carnea]|nr:transposase family protein [Saccharothrix carnea]